ncbi:hypothetical protein Aduo_013567 [Ancylostoma duodenale]
MWYLIVFLACLHLVHADGQSICPKTKPAVSDFVIFANVVEKMKPEEGLIPYHVTDIGILKLTRLIDFGSTIYTLREAPDSFNVTLVPGSRYMLEGTIRITAALDEKLAMKFSR